MSYGASVNGVKGKRNRVEGTTRALCRSHNATDQRSHDSTTHSTRGTRPPDCILIRHGEHARTAAADTETAMHHAQSRSSPDSAEGEAKIHRSHGVSSTSLPDRSISRTSRSNPRFISLFPPVLSPRVSALRAARPACVFEQRRVDARARAAVICGGVHVEMACVSSHADGAKALARKLLCGMRNREGNDCSNALRDQIHGCRGNRNSCVGEGDASPRRLRRSTWCVNASKRC